MNKRLKRCPDCGNWISKRATFCPRCGRELRIAGTYRLLVNLGAVVVLIVLLIVLWALYASGVLPR